MHEDNDVDEQNEGKFEGESEARRGRYIMLTHDDMLRITGKKGHPFSWREALDLNELSLTYIRSASERSAPVCYFRVECLRPGLTDSRRVRRLLKLEGGYSRLLLTCRWGSMCVVSLPPEPDG